MAWTKKKTPAPTPEPRCDACVTPSLCGVSVWHDVGPNCRIAQGLPAVGPDTCDCLNQCGDDPWLKDGRSAPCVLQSPEAAATAHSTPLAALQAAPGRRQA